MSKYKLIGSYDGNDISMKKIENTVVAQIPLKKRRWAFSLHRKYS